MDRREKESVDMFDGYDPELVREAIAATTGSWADLDIEAIVEEVYRAREEGTRPISRP